MDESESSVQTNSSEIFTTHDDNQEMAEYGNGLFIKLRDRDISATANFIGKKFSKCLVLNNKFQLLFIKYYLYYIYYKIQFHIKPL